MLVDVTGHRYGPRWFIAIGLNLVLLAWGHVGLCAIMVYPVDPYAATPILPATNPIPVLPSGRIEIQACRGESEPGSFVIRASQPLAMVRMVPTDLTSEGGTTISASAVDLRLVKCWYQAGTVMRNPGQRVLVPELLVKDDDLVRVDLNKQRNYLRVDAAGKTRYIEISTGGATLPTRVVFNDAKNLLPFDLSAHFNKQVWVTVNVPDRAVPGKYTGKIVVEDANGWRAEISLEVTVLPFDLAPPVLEYAIYYRGKVTSDSYPEIGSELKSSAQYGRELNDMKDHGIGYPTLYQRYDDLHLREAFAVRQRMDFAYDHLYTLGTTTANRTDPRGLAELDWRVRIWVSMARRYGYGKVYIYGVDEAREERLEAQRSSWEVVHREGAGMFVALYEGAVDVAGDDIDVAILSGFKPAEVEKWHRKGKRVLCYGNPQVVTNDMTVYRRNYGLLLWLGRYDGCMPYAYQHAFGNIWNDFDHPKYRDHVFAYPTSDGLVGTVQWEGFREAVDDVRYLSTFLRIEPQAEFKVRRYLASKLSDDHTQPSELREWLIDRIVSLSDIGPVADK